MPMTEKWPDWRRAGVVEELHYFGAVRARVTETERGWLVAFPIGVSTVRNTRKEAIACAENDVACDADLPRVPGTAHPHATGVEQETVLMTKDDDAVFEFTESKGSPPTYFYLRVMEDGSLDLDVGGEYGGTMDAAAASRLAAAILKRTD